MHPYLKAVPAAPRSAKKREHKKKQDDQEHEILCAKQAFADITSRLLGHTALNKIFIVYVDLISIALTT